MLHIKFNNDNYTFHRVTEMLISHFNVAFCLKFTVILLLDTLTESLRSVINVRKRAQNDRPVT